MHPEIVKSRSIIALAIFSIGVMSQIYLNEINAAQFFGAIFTSLADGQTVNQNLYADKSAVYLNGGAQNQNANGLPNGTYYFQITDPSGSVLLSTDDAVCRQVEVATGSNGSGVILGASTASPVYCRHANGIVNPNNGGSLPVQAAPFNDTPNSGGEYKMWLIRQTGTTTIDAGDPRVLNFQHSNAKTDNFKVKNLCQIDPKNPACFTPENFSIGGAKFYDADADGNRDISEPGVTGIRISIVFTPALAEPNPVIRTTDANGSWSVTDIPAGTDYAVSEILPPPCAIGTYWRQTAPVAPGTYSGTISNSDVFNLDFGDLCFRPAAGGRTLGFWSNKNGERLMQEGLNNFENALIMLRGLPLKTTRTRDQDFEPASYSQFRTWLLNGNAVNMSYMLSVQLAATSLDVRYGLLRDSQIVDTTDYNDPLNPADDEPRIGFASIGFIRQQAMLMLSNDGYTPTGDPHRTAQELYKDILDDVNNNRLPFASATPCSLEICY